MHPYIAKELADFRHTELVARAGLSRRSRAARIATSDAGNSGRSTARLDAVRRLFPAMHAWFASSGRSAAATQTCSKC